MGLTMDVFFHAMELFIAPRSRPCSSERPPGSGLCKCIRVPKCICLLQASTLFMTLQGEPRGAELGAFTTCGVHSAQPPQNGFCFERSECSLVLSCPCPAEDTRPRFSTSAVLHHCLSMDSSQWLGQQPVHMIDCKQPIGCHPNHEEHNGC